MLSANKYRSFQFALSSSAFPVMNRGKRSVQLRSPICVFLLRANSFAQR